MSGNTMWDPSRALPGMNDPEAAMYGLSATNDPYQQMLMRRRMMAEALGQKDEPRPLTHWTQVLGEIANKGVNSWKQAKLDRDILDYSRQKTERADNAFRDLFAGGLVGNQSPPPAPSSAPVQPPANQGDAPASAKAQDFIRRFAPEAVRVGKETGLDPRLILAQSANETGWGAKAPGNNYFGIKGPGQTLNTTEVVNGQRVPMQDTFRAYETPEASFSDYAKFIRENPRYAPVLQAQGLENQITAMGKSGYATDPQYAQKLNMLARGIQIPEAAPTPVQVAQAPTGTMTDAGGGGTVQVPGVGPMNREQIRQMTAMILMNPNLSADPRYARMAQGLGALAQSIPEPKLQGYAPGSEIRDQFGRIVGRVPERPMTVSPGSAMVDPRTGQPIYMNPADPATTRIQMTNDLRGEGSFAQNRGKAIAERVGDWEAAWDKGHQERTRIANFAKMQEQFDTGAFSTTKITLGQVAQRLGIPDAALSSLGMDRNQVASGEVIRSISNKMMMENLGPGGFPSQNFSNADAERLAQSLPGLANSPQGNKIMLRIAGAVADRKIEIGKAWRQWARSNGESLDSVTRFQQEKLPGIVERDVIAPLLESAPTGASAPPAAVDFLRANPGEAAAFDQKYGPGAAARALGGQ